MTRRSLEQRFAVYKVRIVHNVGPSSGPRWSVETDKGSPLGWGCLGTVESLRAAETLIEDKIAMHEESKGEHGKD